MNFFRKTVAMTLLVPFVGGCVQPISDDSAKALTDLTERASSTLSAPLALQMASHTESSYNKRLCAYLSGRSNFALGVGAGPAGFTKLAQEQAVVGKALQDYLAALLAASRGGEIETLRTAQTNFVTATSAFVEQAGLNPQTGEIVGAALALANQIGEAGRQARIRKIMDEMIGPLADLERRMAADVALAVQETEASLAKWDKAARCVLIADRSHGASIETFEVYDTRRKALSQQLAAVVKGPEIIRELNRMHIRVVEEDVPLADAFDAIVTTLERIDTLIDAVS